MSTPKRFNRRTLIGGAAAGIGTYALLGGPAVLTSRGQVATGGRFTQSVASGEPAPDAITLWTRVEEASGASRVELEISKDESFGSLELTDSVPIADGNPIVKTRVEDLDPGEQYFYRFATSSDNSPVGRFRTARPADSNEPVKVAFFSCQEYVSGFYHAHRDLAQMDDIDLVVCLGDYVYEQTFDTSGSAVREDPTGEVFTVDEYRDKYDFYQTDPDLLEMRRMHPMMAIWDDHEVEDNYAKDLPGGASTQRPTTYRSRQAAGYQVFFEYMPRFPVGSRSRIYTRIPLGNAEVFLLDTRQYRDNQVCSPGDAFASLPGCPATELNKPGRTLLGDDQREWLKDALGDSDAKWKIVGTQVMIMSLDVPARNPLNSDSWDGYGDERRDLVDFIDAEDIRNVSFITGDIHTFFAGSVTRSGRLDGAIGDPPANEEGVIVGGVPRATEFVGGSITSKGILDRANENEEVRDVPDVIAGIQSTANNPHIVFSDQAFKGYGILTAGDDLEVEYRRVCDVTSPANRSVDTLAKFTVEGDQEAPVVQCDPGAVCGPNANQIGPCEDDQGGGGGPLPIPPAP